VSLPGIRGRLNEICLWPEGRNPRDAPLSFLADHAPHGVAHFSPIRMLFAVQHALFLIHIAPPEGSEILSTGPRSLHPLT
jgi:hypothetical protein